MPLPTIFLSGAVILTVFGNNCDGILICISHDPHIALIILLTKFNIIFSNWQSATKLSYVLFIQKSEPHC